MSSLASITADDFRWLTIGAGGLAVCLFETAQRRRKAARQRHVTMRERWLQAVLTRPGQEIVAIQTIRNSLMAATIVSSTTVVALMGTVSLVAPVAFHLATQGGGLTLPAIQLVVGGLLIATLFASFLFATQAARFYNHLGYLVGFGPAVEDGDREAAQRYVALAGRYYSDSLRTLVYLAPLTAGLLEPFAVLPAAILVLVVLSAFERVAARSGR